jgi:hypothetical protein
MDNPAVPFDTATAAYALSQALVEEARAHVDSMLSSDAWMRANRHVCHPSGDFAIWRVPGNSQLTFPEQQRLRNLYLKSGWAKVEFVETDHLQPGSWVLRFYL